MIEQDRIAALERIVSHICCADCADDHMEMPESVSCYCRCHDSTRDEIDWAAMRDVALQQWPSRPSHAEWCEGRGGHYWGDWYDYLREGKHIGKRRYCTKCQTEQREPSEAYTDAR